MASVTETARAIVDIDGKAAGEKLKELKQKTKDLKEELKQLKISGDKAGFEAKKRELEGINKKIEETRRSTWDLQKVMQNLNGTSLKDLERAQRQLTNEIRNSSRATDEEREALKRKAQQLKDVKQEVTKLKVETGQAANTNKSFLSGMSDGFNKYFGIATAFVASLTGVVFGFRKLVEMANNYGASVANLSALTGLAGRELNWLSNQAKEVAKNGTDAGIKVTAGAQAIVDAYTLMGSAKPELLKNKEALDEVTQSALIMADAAKISATEAVESLANTMNQFNAPASEANKYINILAAGSKEGAAAIPSISASMVKFGAAAASANISVEESVGLIETLAEKGLKGELAGTQIKTALIKMQTGADDTNPSIVGLNTALENLRKKNLSTAEMVKFFGQEAFIAGQIIVKESERVKYFTNAVTDTNVALEQARINTESDAAAKQRAINKYELTAIKLGERLAPAVTFSTNAFTYLMKAVIGTIDLFDKMTGNVTKANDAFDNQLNKVVDLETNIKPLLSRYDELSIKTVKSKEEHEEMKSIIEQVSETIPSAITQFDKYGNAVSISTSRVKDYIAAETDRLKVVNAEAIRANQKKLDLIIQQESISRERLNEIAKKGYFTVYETVSTGTTSIQTTRKATEQEIKAEQDKYQSLISQKNGYNAEIKRLNGDAINEELQRRETERKAAEENERKIIEYKKKSFDELKKLSESGDNIAKQLIDSGEIINQPIINIKNKYQQLGEEISKAREQLAIFVTEGKLEDAMQVQETIDLLVIAKQKIDELIAAGGDITKVASRMAISPMTPITSIPVAGAQQAGTMAPRKPTTQNSEDNNGFDKEWYLDQAQTASNAAFDIWRSSQDARLDYEIKTLNAAMEKELSNKYLTEEQKDKIRERYAKKERALKVENFKKQKAADIIQSVINTALAVVKALPNIPLSIAAGIAGAAQTAVIASQPIPTFYSGGETGAGIGLTDQYGSVAGVVHANEYVIPEWMRGIPQVMAFERIMEGIRTNRGYAAGGNVNNSSTVVNNHAAPAVVTDHMLVSAINRLNNNIEKGIRSKLVLQEFEEFTDKYNLIEDESSF